MDRIICPGCGWAGENKDLKRGACPQCEYENGMPPNRLLTLEEILEDEVEYDEVRLDLFLSSVFRVIGFGERNELGRRCI